MFGPLTKRQLQVLNFIEYFMAKFGYAPSLEEIGWHLGLSSLATVHKHLSNLEDRGRIKRGWNRARHITVIATEGHCPTCGRELAKVAAKGVENAEQF